MNDISDEVRLDWLQLGRTRGIGPGGVEQLIQRFGSPGEALKSGGRIFPKGIASRADAETELQKIFNAGGQLLVVGEDAYPELLKAIPDPPTVITVFGRTDLLYASNLAIVGARNASANGKRIANMLAFEASNAGSTIISGLARGIDTAAHQGGLRGEGSTVAVLGCGADICYPSENAALFDLIAENGTIVSECAWGTPPRPKQFPRRNRIISGLSWGVLVVEAAERSGSLMTARLALDQGREVMAVPGSPLDARHKGTNKILKEGAALVESLEDIVAAKPFYEMIKPQVRRASRPSPRAKEPDVKANSKAVKPKKPVSVLLNELLGADPLSVDELIRQCHGTAAEVQDALIELELDGRLIRHTGNCVSLEMGPETTRSR